MDPSVGPDSLKKEKKKKKKDHLPVSEIESLFIENEARALITVPTELFRLPEPTFLKPHFNTGVLISP